jgi:hypothetical protein
MMLIHVIGGMGVEVAGTEHVATARFDVAGGHVEIGFGRFLLRRRREIDETGSERTERNKKESRPTTHDPSNGFVQNGAQPGITATLLPEFEGFNRISLAFLFDLNSGSNVRPFRLFAKSRLPSGVTADPLNPALNELLKKSFGPLDTDSS